MAKFSVLPQHKIALLLFVLLSVSGLARAQYNCGFGGEENADALVKALSHDKSCHVAADRLNHCAWGSSADTQFAPIVVAKCEKTFFDKLPPAGKERYEEEMQLCAYEYARAQGTMYMSAAAMCQVDIAEQYSANPALANKPLAHASFDCGKAQAPLEKAICSDIHLGKADIVLSRVYAVALKSDDKSDKHALIESERKWLEGIPATCGLNANPLSQKSLNCLRIAFELRFTALDDCEEGSAAGEYNISQCLQTDSEEETVANDNDTAAGQRASFDCESPSTGLEIVICADAELGQDDIRLADIYHKADQSLGAAQHKQLVESERNWLHFVNQCCPLGAIGGIPPVLTRACLRQAFETRIGQLLQCPKKAPSEQISCLNDFQLFEK